MTATLTSSFLLSFSLISNCSPHPGDYIYREHVEFHDVHLNQCRMAIFSPFTSEYTRLLKREKQLSELKLNPFKYSPEYSMDFLQYDV